MNRNPITIIIILVLVIFGSWFFLSGSIAKAPVDNTQIEATTGTTTNTAATATLEPEVSITYTDRGFAPKSVTVPFGTTVTFVNRSSGNMWVASAAHPTHTVYSGTSLSQHCPDASNTAFDECTADAPGKSFSFTFNKEGEWKYHDHIDATNFGTVIVTSTATSSAPQLQ